MVAVQSLGVLDYVVLGIMLSVSMGIGIFFAIRSKETRDDYLLGGRQMSIGSVAISMFVTLQSAISLLGTPAEVYTYGTMALYMYVGYSLTYILGLYTCLPLLYSLKITSVYEYFEMRFESKAVRLLATVIGMLQTMAYMSVALLSPGLALQAVAGLPLWWSIVIVGLVGTVYTSIGGMKSVVWTDVFQSIVMAGGIVAVVVLGTVRVGGPMDVLHIAASERRIQYDDINPDPRVRHTVWGLIIGGFINWYPSLISQSMVQRLSSLKSMTGAKVTYLINAPMVLLYGAVLTITGLVLFSYMYSVGCDPYESDLISNRNQLMPYFIMHVLSSLPGVTGLYMSVLFSGALSTLSSGINALAANTVEDILGPVLQRSHASERVTTVIAKLAVCFYGLLAIGLAYLARAMQGPVTQISMTVFGSCGGPLFGMFLLGSTLTFTNKYGVFIGGVSGLGLNIWIGVMGLLYGRAAPTLRPAPTYGCDGPLNVSVSFHIDNNTVYDFSISQDTMTLNTKPDSLPDHFSVSDISYIWYGTIGTVSTMVVGILVSLISGLRGNSPLAPNLVFPFVRRLCKLEDPYTPVSTISSAQHRAMSNYRFSWDMFKRSCRPDEYDTLEMKQL